MEYEGVDNNANTNTTAVAQELQDNLTATPPEKKPSKLASILEKLGKSPLFIGRRKFVSLPLVGLALVAVVFVPVVIKSARLRRALLVVPV